jgi:AbrB family looped-hinge helix DNA binding protein
MADVDRRRYAKPMTTTVDEAGRVAIPAEVRERLGWTAGAEIEMVVEGFSIRLVRAVPGPVVRRGEPLMARPRAAEGERAQIDVARWGEIVGRVEGSFFRY